MDILNQAKESFDKALDHLRNELLSLRTDRVSPALVENLMVDCYGIKTPLVQLASINIGEPQTIVVQPWDKNIIKEVEKAIQNSNLGLNPIVQDKIIRIVIPPLSEERRKEIIKLLHQKLEEAKISIRNIREDIIKQLKAQEKEGKISEDDLFLHQKELQKEIDKYNEEIKKIGEEKEKEIMTV